MQKSDMSLAVRRRLETINDGFFWHADEVDPCSYSSVGEFISDTCDFANNIIDEDLRESGIKLRPYEKDILYNYFVDRFGKKLSRIFMNRCNPE
jgi:hypothetical protein